MMQAFDDVRRFLHTQTGICLGAEKNYLIESRLAGLVRQHAEGDWVRLAAQLTREPRGPIAAAAISALATHETSWFRDQRPFERLRDEVLPSLRGRSGRQLSIWSAACSSGQEIYCLALLLAQEGFIEPHWRVQMLASDICSESLAQARRGRYSHFEMERGLPGMHAQRFFSREGDEWRIAPSLQENIRFECVNLISVPPALGVFDVIFCRNVLIYFDRVTQRQVLRSLRDHLAPGGYLFLGAAESPLGLCEGLRAHGGFSGLYRRAE
ncbi:MAG: Chemotaxis protein methyltransferase CheR [Hyphomicrobiales bacterium]|nr:Chemotaxis protein methyltransferase CheR [Hyphomicrobiales bacterium]